MNILGLAFCVLACVYVARAHDREPPEGAEGYYWRDFENMVPEDALKAGPDTYIAQVLTHGILQPAQLNKIDRKAVFAYGGSVYMQKRGFKVLCTTDENQFEWIVTDNETLKYLLASRYFLTGGSDDGYPLLIGRSMETAQVGKITVYYANAGLSYVQDDAAQHANNFEVIAFKKSLK